MLIAKITGKNINYDMYKDVISIGRNSAIGNVDIDMGNSTTFVSRKHLELLYLDDLLKLRCLGKNGIFVNDSFKSHSSKASVLYDLPNKCVLRFPSTNVKLNVTLLAEPKSEGIDLEEVKTSESKVVIPHPSIASFDHSAFQDASALLSLKGNNISFSPMPCDNTGEHLIPKSLCQTDGQQQQQPNVTRPEYLVNSGPKFESPSSQAYPSDYSSDDISIDRGSEHTKPPYSYAQLIVQAIMSARSQQMTLSGIYAYISQNYPYYKLRDKGWQNSIRHNLSLNRYFVKVARSQEEPGKGSFWRVDPHYKKPLIQQAFRRRRHRRLSHVSSNSPFSDHAVLTNGRLFIPRGCATLLHNDKPQFIKINKNLLGASWNSNQSFYSSSPLISSTASGYAQSIGQQEVLLASSLSASLNRESGGLASVDGGGSGGGNTSPDPPILEPSNFQVQVSPNKFFTNSSSVIQDDNAQKLKHHQIYNVDSQIRPSVAQDGLVSLGGKLYTAVSLNKHSMVQSASLNNNKLPLYITNDGSKYLVLNPQNTTAESTAVDMTVDPTKSNSSSIMNKATTNTEDNTSSSSTLSHRLLISLPSYHQTAAPALNSHRPALPLTLTLKRNASSSPPINEQLQQQRTAEENDSLNGDEPPPAKILPKSSVLSPSLSLIADRSS